MEHKMHAWLALRRRCWTADRLAKRGLPSLQVYSLCKTVGETLKHLSLHCPFALQVWSGTDAQIDLDIGLPTAEQDIGDCWTSIVDAMPIARRKEANSIIMLVLRSIWLERNARVFDGKEQPTALLTQSIVDEWRSWVAARLRGRRVRDVH
jgi:hypothetical protein